MLISHVGKPNPVRRITSLGTLSERQILDFYRLIMHNVSRIGTYQTGNKMTRECIIYAIVHLASGRRYVGSTIDRKARWSEHKTNLKFKRHHCTYLQNAWNKYGADAFEFRTLEVIKDHDKESRLRAELGHIMDAPYYNCRIAGISFTNFENGPLTREKISRTLSSKLKTDELYRYMLSQRGAELAEMARTPEARAKMSKQATSLWKNKAHRARVSKKLAVHWDKPGAREKHSELTKLHRGTPEARLQNSDRAKRRWADPASKMHTRKQTRWADPKAREIQGAKMKVIHAARRAAKRVAKQKSLFD